MVERSMLGMSVALIAALFCSLPYVGFSAALLWSKREDWALDTEELVTAIWLSLPLSMTGMVLGYLAGYWSADLLGQQGVQAQWTILALMASTPLVLQTVYLCHCRLMRESSA